MAYPVVGEDGKDAAVSGFAWVACVVSPIVTVSFSPRRDANKSDHFITPIINLLLVNFHSPPILGGGLCLDW